MHVFVCACVYVCMYVCMHMCEWMRVCRREHSAHTGSCALWVAQSSPTGLEVGMPGERLTGQLTMAGGGGTARAVARG